MRAAEQIILIALGRAGTPGPAFLPIWNAGLAARAAGTRNAKLLVIGDSTTAGWGGQGTSAQSNAIAYSWPRKLAAYLPFGSDSSWFADKNTLVGGAISLATFDNRVVLGSWVQTLGGTPTLGGPMLTCTTGTTALQFTPLNVVDTFDIYTRRLAGLGTFTAAIDAGGTTSIDQTVSPGTVVKTTLTAALGIHTLNLARVSGNVDLVGVVAYNSAQKETTVINAGWSGSVAADWQAVNGPMDPLLMIPVVAPDLTIICLTINDWVAATSTSAYTASMQAIITAAVSAGSDVVLMSGVPTDPATTSAAQQLTYRNIVQSLATSNNVPYLDMTAQWTSWTVANGNGWMFDAKHPNGLGYAQIPAVINSTIRYTQTYSTEAQAVIGAFTTPPTTDRKAIINYTIDMLKLSSAWSLIDVMHLTAAADSQALTINWKNPGTFNLVAVNAPTFTADRGFAGNGTSSYYRTQFTPSVNGVNYTRDNASFWVWNNTNTQNAAGDIGNNTTSPLALLVARNTTDQTTIRMNDATALAGSTTNGQGWFGGQRTGSTARKVWKNNASIGSDTQASTGLPTTEMWLGASNSGTFSTHQIAADMWAASLSGKEAAVFNAMQAYMRFVGAL